MKLNGTETEVVIGEPWMRFSLSYPKLEPKPILEHQIRLDPIQAHELLRFLQDNQSLLKQMANEDTEQQKRVLQRVYSMLIEALLRKMQEEHVDM